MKPDLSCPLCEAPAEKAKLKCDCCDREMQGVLAWETLPSRLRLRCQVCHVAFDKEVMYPEIRGVLSKLMATLREKNEGRNRSCWPLVSFGWKDADLDPEGCTGIKQIVGVHDNEVIYLVGGHKTVVSSDCLDTEDEGIREEFDDCTRNLFIGAGCKVEWDGDDWCYSFSSKISVPPVRRGRGEARALDYSKSADLVIRKARQVCRSFERDMARLSKEQDKLYKRLQQKIDDKEDEEKS